MCYNLSPGAKMAIHEKNTIRGIGARLKKLREHLDYSRDRMMEQNQQFRYEVLAFFYKYKKETASL